MCCVRCPKSQKFFLSSEHVESFFYSSPCRTTTTPRSKNTLILHCLWLLPPTHPQQPVFGVFRYYPECVRFCHPTTHKFREKSKILFTRRGILYIRKKVLNVITSEERVEEKVPPSSIYDAYRYNWYVQREENKDSKYSPITKRLSSVHHFGFVLFVLVVALFFQPLL